MFTLKPISPESVPSALAKAERYRLLNEPQEAESICRDILAIEPDNQQALISLILALTDQLASDAHAFANTLSVVERLQAPYDRAYYAGIAWERRAKARYHGGHGAHQYVYEWIMRAMELFEDAERLRPAGNDDALLRWNACVRYLARHKELVKPTVEVAEPIVSE
jgi:hypothetical protein